MVDLLTELGEAFEDLKAEQDAIKKAQASMRGRSRRYF